jgi:hypothetical protein
VGEFAKWAAPLLKEADSQEVPMRPRMRDWKERSADQLQRMRRHIPTSREESDRNTQEALEQIKKLMHGLGYQFRMQRHLAGSPEQDSILPAGEPGIPGRDVSITLPKSAEWLEPRLLSKEALGPIQAGLQTRAIETKSKFKEKKRRAFMRTESPLTNPLFGPMAVITAPEAFRHGFQQADTDAQAAKNKILDRKLEEAKNDFEQALAEEYLGQKSASAGQWIDEFAQVMLKAADDRGIGMKMLNTYLTLATLLGYGTHRASKKFVEKHEPAAQKHKLLRMALRQKMHERGVPILVDFDELPAAHTEDFVEQPSPQVEQPSPQDVQFPFFETKEAAIPALIMEGGKLIHRISRPSIKPLTLRQLAWPSRGSAKESLDSLKLALRTFAEKLNKGPGATPLAGLERIFQPGTVQEWEKRIPAKVRENLIARTARGKLPGRQLARRYENLPVTKRKWTSSMDLTPYGKSLI